MKVSRNQRLLNAFGARLRDVRQQRGLSLRELGDNAEVDFSSIHRIEQGVMNPSLVMLVTLATALKVPLSELLDFPYPEERKR